MNRAEATRLNEVVEKALNGALASMGYAAVIRGGMIEGGTLKPKITIAKVNPTGILETSEFQALKLRHPDKAGKTYYVPGRGYLKLVGYNSRAPKMPVLVEKDGKTWKFGTFILDQCVPAREAVATAR